MDNKKKLIYIGIFAILAILSVILYMVGLKFTADIVALMMIVLFVKVVLWD